MPSGGPNDSSYSLWATLQPPCCLLTSMAMLTSEVLKNSIRITILKATLCCSTHRLPVGLSQMVSHAEFFTHYHRSMALQEVWLFLQARLRSTCSSLIKSQPGLSVPLSLAGLLRYHSLIQTSFSFLSSFLINKHLLPYYTHYTSRLSSNRCENCSSRKLWKRYSYKVYSRLPGRPSPGNNEAANVYKNDTLITVLNKFNT